MTVTIFEAADRVGKTILATGNGRCNFSNRSIDAGAYHNADFVADAFKVLPPQEVREFFSELGLLWFEEAEGRLYPLTNKATSVVDVLRFALADESVMVRCGEKASRLRKEGDAFRLATDKGTFAFDAVILACGWRGASSLLIEKHTHHEPVPVLGPLATDTAFLKGLNNIRIRAAISYEGHREEGEVLFRDYGVSGIAVFNLSRFAAPGNVLEIDFLPQISEARLEVLLADRLERFGHRNPVDFFAGMLLSAVARTIVRKAGIQEDARLQAGDMPRLAKTLKHFDLMVKGIADPARCQVHRGGFAVADFNPATMESLQEEGFFAAGEALDVDGPCGGFNLHWAWTSGIAAGRAAYDAVARI